MYQAATATTVDAEVVRQLNLLSLTHRRAAETLRNQFSTAFSNAATHGSNVQTAPAPAAAHVVVPVIVGVAGVPAVVDDDDSSSPRSSDGSAQVVDLNDLLASASHPRSQSHTADDDDVDVDLRRRASFPEDLSENDDDNDDHDADEDADDDDDDDDDSFVGLTSVKAPPVFRESGTADAPAAGAGGADLPHSMWGSFERLVGKVLQASAKMLAESIDDRRSSLLQTNSVEAELAKLPRKSSSDSLTDEFVVVRETTPEPSLRGVASVHSADPSRSSSPIAQALDAALQRKSLQPPVPLSPPSRSDTPSVGCTTADDMGVLVRQLGDALRRAADDNTSGDDVPVNMATLQNAVSALRTAMAWRRRLTLLQTNNEQLHNAVLQLNAEVLRRAQEARSGTPPAAMYASSSHVSVGNTAGAENARLQSEVALLRRQLASVLALTTRHDRARATTPPRKQTRRQQPAQAVSTIVTPPPPAASADAVAGASQTLVAAGRPKSVTFNVPGATGDTAPKPDASPTTTDGGSSGGGGGFDQRSRLTSSEPLIERADSSPHNLSPRRAQQAGAESSETSTTPSGATTPLASSAKDAFGAQQVSQSLRQHLNSDTLTSSCDD